MNKKKLTIISVVLVMIMAVGGVLAYLTDTAEVTNTFTVGDVDITLDEAKVDPDGTPVEGADRVIENNYHLVPGQEYVKDPIITVTKGSEPSYVRMILTVHNASAVNAIIANPVHQDTNGDNVFDYADLFDGWASDKWLYRGFTEDTAANTISFEFRYFEPVDASEATDDIKLPALFTKLVIPGTLNNDELKALYGDLDGNGETDSDQEAVKVVVTGHAIQAVGFEDTTDANGVVTEAEDNAWAAFDTQAKVNHNAPETTEAE